MSELKLDTQLCFALYSASNYLSQIYRSLLEQVDLTYTQFIVLMALGEEDNISISALADRLGLTKATMTPLLRRLEQKQFIERRIEAGNERQKNISLTATGQDLLASSGVDITEQAFCNTGLSKTQAKDMIALCKVITGK
ncbi:MAG: MarR family transcriptional regulator [Stappiaceae bacterium]